ncbi:MAG: hypothetical protein ACNFW9_05445 [Candidatus Kerfeldbacteria bacterium]
MLEYLLKWFADGVKTILYDPFMSLFTSTSVPLTILFVIVMLLSIALAFSIRKFGAHKYLGKPVRTIAPFLMLFFFSFGMNITGNYQEGDIADTSDQGTHVLSSGDYQITGDLDPILGGYNISLTPTSVMEDPMIINKWEHTKTTHWDPWQINDATSLESGQIVTVAITGLDQRLFTKLKERPISTEEEPWWSNIFNESGSDKTANGS